MKRVLSESLKKLLSKFHFTILHGKNEVFFAEVFKNLVKHRPENNLLDH